MFLFALTGQEILDKVEQTMKEPKTMIATSEVILENFDGSGREIRTMKSWFVKDTARMMKFLSPPAQRGVGVLIKNPGKPSEQIWLYLPAFRRVRRIATSTMKNQSFQGTDFSYSDLSHGYSYKKDYSVVDSKKVEGGYVLKLKRKPGSDRPYAELILYVGPDFTIKRIEMLKKGKVVKRLLIKNYVKQAGYMLPTELCMEDFNKKHRTIMKVKNRKVNPPLGPGFFTLRNLRAGVK